MPLELAVLDKGAVELEGDALPLSGFPVNDGVGIPPDDEVLAADELSDTGVDVVNVLV